MSKPKIFLLAAGYNKHAQRPCSLWSFSNGKSILDWQTHAFEKALPGNQVNIIVGYDYQKILANHPYLNFSYVLDWEKSNALQSFLSVINDFSTPTLVMYGDTVFYPETLTRLIGMEGDAVVVIDSVWKQRFSGRSQKDIAIAETLNIHPYGEVEYTGLVKFSPKVMNWISDHRDIGHSNRNFIDLINDIRDAGFNVAAYDVIGSWSEMNEPNDLVHFILGNKAETLRRIRPQLKKSEICDQITCTQQDWKNNPSLIIKRVQAQFEGQRLIVRSSYFEEDSWETSNAGVFESILDIDCNDTHTIRKAIEHVFLSYGNPCAHAQVLIQPFISNVAMSGVIFTCDLVTGAPYYIINYDDVSGRPDSITSGQKSDLRTAIIFRRNIDAVHKIDSRLVKLIEAAKELEQILGYNKLDIEFAIDKENQMYIFQVRPIAVKHDAHQIDEKQLELFLQSAWQHFKKWQKKSPSILGDDTIFSGITDWNPAEIIGNRPNPLAINLYHYLITEDIWARQRAEYGYRDVRPAPLVHNFCSQPYVDCRASINSLIPASLPEEVALRLANVYLDILKDNHQLHDKVELDVVFTIWVPTFRQDAEIRFKNRNISTQDIDILEQALKKLTARALVRLNEDTSSIKCLSERFVEVVGSHLDPVDKAYQLIADCRRFGTLAFAHAARAGFVAVALLKSFIQKGTLSQERMLEFQASVSTVAGDFQNALADHGVSVDVLIKQFGHLRPGTYDVNQTAYWEKPDFYFDRQRPRMTQQTACDGLVFTKHEREGFQAFLDALPTEIEVDEFIRYLSQAIQAREKTKFEFSRNLSVALDLLIQYGTEVLGLTREEVGYLTFDDIKALKIGQLDEKLIPKFVKLRKTDSVEKHLAKLPSLICCENDFFGYEQEKSQANFITRLSVVAELLFIKANQNEPLDGKIVVIPSADPGFDWLFSHNIAGLITQYGGANSHMAIRCAELGIPAAIGIGDKQYDSLQNGRMILDCHKGRFEYV
ncbi:hypothetical protein CJJ19_05215 [Candidatus Williamhamiltonella defendens]|nr:PEP-utilizing enzyme [Candidatus Hamiltonella defensa]AYB48931.1 hypothetical protein CJJ19_05215 [Candidatus Hamiltonella defensa]